MNAFNSNKNAPQDDTLQAALAKLTPEEREALEADYKRQQSEKVSARNKATAARLRAEGRPYSGKPKLGFKRIVDKDGLKRDVPDPKQRALMQEIVRLRDAGETYRAISNKVARKCLIAAGQKPVPGALTEWNEMWVRRAYTIERDLQAKGQ